MTSASFDTIIKKYLKSIFIYLIGNIISFRWQRNIYLVKFVLILDTSKRQTLHQKYKIEKRVKQHNKKVRKEAKKVKSLGLGFKNTQKGLKLPNLYPHKRQLIEDMERKKPTNARREMIES